MIEDRVTVKGSSYRHNQEWKLIHHQFLDSNHSGNATFAQQLQTDEGIFDIVDAFREKEIEISATQSPSKLPRKNVVELQWNNNIVEKKPYRDGRFEDEYYHRNFFHYNKIFSFNISQGLDISDRQDEDQSLRKKLTRLALEMTLNLEKLTLSSKEFYFYEGKHIYEFNLSSRGKYIDYSLGLLYNSVDEDVASNSVKLGLVARPTARLSFVGDYDLGLDFKEENKQQNYDLIYTPSNECWKLALGFSDDGIETRVGIDFRIRWSKQLF